MDQPEDRELVARVIEGDGGAFRGLVDRHGERVHRLCFCILRHHQDAEDAAQEAFLRAYRAIRRFDPQYAFTAWLLKIATNLCRDRLRRRRTDLPLVDRDRMPEPAAPDPGPGALHDDQQALMRQVERAVAALDHPYRVVFHLYHREERSYDEIAAILGRPIGTIKTQLHRARRRVCDLAQQSDGRVERDRGPSKGGPR